MLSCDWSVRRDLYRFSDVESSVAIVSCITISYNHQNITLKEATISMFDWLVRFVADLWKSIVDWFIWKKNTVPTKNLWSFTISHSQTNMLYNFRRYNWVAKQLSVYHVVEQQRIGMHPTPTTTFHDQVHVSVCIQHYANILLTCIYACKRTIFTACGGHTMVA